MHYGNMLKDTKVILPDTHVKCFYCKKTRVPFLFMLLCNKYCFVISIAKWCERNWMCNFLLQVIPGSYYYCYYHNVVTHVELKNRADSYIISIV